MVEGLVGDRGGGVLGSHLGVVLVAVVEGIHCDVGMYQRREERRRGVYIRSSPSNELV